jgi:hypothetical protein
MFSRLNKVDLYGTLGNSRILDDAIAFFFLQSSKDVLFRGPRDEVTLQVNFIFVYCELVSGALVLDHASEHNLVTRYSRSSYTVTHTLPERAKGMPEFKGVCPVGEILSYKVPDSVQVAMCSGRGTVCVIRASTVPPCPRSALTRYSQSYC